jgi:hypothetical protein
MANETAAAMMISRERSRRSNGILASNDAARLFMVAYILM